MISRFLIAGLIFGSVTVFNAVSRLTTGFMHPIFAVILYAIALNIFFWGWIRRGIVFTVLMEAMLIAAAIGLSWFFVGI